MRIKVNVIALFAISEVQTETRHNQGQSTFELMCRSFGRVRCKYCLTCAHGECFDSNACLLPGS